MISIENEDSTDDSVVVCAARCKCPKCMPMEIEISDDEIEIPPAQKGAQRKATAAVKASTGAAAGSAIPVLTQKTRLNTKTTIQYVGLQPPFKVVCRNKPAKQKACYLMAPKYIIGVRESTCKNYKEVIKQAKKLLDEGRLNDKQQLINWVKAMASG